MSELPRIDSEESLRAWLATGTPEDAPAIIHRVSMRVAPWWVSGLKAGLVQGRQPSPFDVLRLNLILAVIRRDPSFGASIEATHVVEIAIAGSKAVARAGSFHAFIAAETAVDVSQLRVAEAVGGSILPFYNEGLTEALQAMWREVETDAHGLINGDDLHDSRLWAEENLLAEAWSEARDVLRNTPGGAFWIDWYQRALDGRPQNWPLLRDVALIDEGMWQEGGEALDREIDRIVERHRLLEEVRRLKAELAEAGSVTAAVPHRGHNQPPELLPDDAFEISAAARTVVQQLDEAEEELQQPTPSPSKLRRIGLSIKRAVDAVLSYCGQLADVALKEAAKKVGAAAGVVVVAYVALHGDRFRALADALMRLAGG